MSFLTEYFGIIGGAREIPVCCPFDHYTTSGIAYKETNPSAHVNTIENLFHCKVCGIGYSEPQFIQQILGCSYLDAKKIQRCFETQEDLTVWEETTQLSEASKQRALDLGIAETVIEELKIKTPAGTADLLAFPVFMYDHLLDIRKYDPGQKPKVKSRANCPAGLIIPFDLWRKTPEDRVTLICAGEKDMAVARSYGFNAITFTSGEGTLPKIWKCFQNRKIAIV